jgi:hypothetical protein
VVVRPTYAGGLSQVVEIYRAAKDRISVPNLLDTLDYVYPYAQAIGFLMQLSGYAEYQINLLRPRVTEYNFYLAHGLKNSAYDATWKIFYPADLGKS